MKKVFLFLTIMVFIAAPFTAFAESPLSLPADSDPGAIKHNKEGLSQYIKGHYEPALKHYEASEQIQRTGEVYFNEALAFRKLGKHGTAKLHFQEAKRMANGNSKILNSEILKSHFKTH